MIQNKTIKRVMGKAQRRARRAGPRSEFIVMCEAIAAREREDRERTERMRSEAEARRNREQAFASRAA